MQRKEIALFQTECAKVDSDVVTALGIQANNLADLKLYFYIELVEVVNPQA